MLDLVPSRRDLLKTGGALVVTFAFAPKLALGQATAKTVSPEEVDGFLAIGADGTVTAYSGKVDLGTGVRTALTQMVAEELDVPLAQVVIVEGDTALTPDQGPTYGSLSIQNGGVQIRQAAATARRALLDMATQRLGSQDLTVEDGTIKGGGKQVTYGELVGGRSLSLKLDKDAPLKDPAKYTIVGKSVPRLDIPAKIAGTFTYMQDFRVDGMLHGRVVRPPAIGATLQSVDEGSVKDVPGLVKVVREGSFLGVVAESEWSAIKAAEMLKATWSDWAGLPDRARLWDYVRATKINKSDATMSVGNARETLAQAQPPTRKLKATYDFAIHTHGSIGPSCAVVEIKEGKLTCWSASQATHNLRKQLAAMLAMPPENVRCLYLDGAGCYGRNGHEDAAGDAALLARAVERPVRVQWSRAEEHGWDPKGPPTLVDMEAALDEKGNVTAWHSQFYIPEGAAGNVPLIAATHAGLPAETALAPGNIIQNSAIGYGIPNVHTVCHRLAETVFRPSWIRTPGRMQNTFANEAFLDELAAAAGKDPIELRLEYLKDPRGAELLQKLVELAKWEKRASPRKDQSGPVAKGRGVSYVKYENVRTYVGAVAEVEVERASGKVRVTKFYVAHDCGQIINPDGVKSQIEGNIIQTVSRTLMEDIQFDRKAVTSLDWESYPILRFPDVPEVEMALIDRPTEKPWGAGEPSAAVVPSAISNAVFDAIGARLRSVPFTPEKVKAAIQGT
jgi:CO/xanthine dehydrogenase Mo-binding subunit